VLIDGAHASRGDPRVRPPTGEPRGSFPTPHRTREAGALQRANPITPRLPREVFNAPRMMGRVHAHPHLTNQTGSRSRTGVLEICLRANHEDDHIFMYPCCIMCSLNISMKKQFLLIDDYVNYL